MKSAERRSLQEEDCPSQTLIRNQCRWKSHAAMVSFWMCLVKLPYQEASLLVSHLNETEKPRPGPLIMHTGLHEPDSQWELQLVK